MKNTLGLLGGLVLVLSITIVGQRRETYDRAELDADGNVQIITSDRRTIILRKDGHFNLGLPADLNQSSFDKPVISEDRRAVGVAANFPNAATSYDVPLQLVIYTGGKVHRLTGLRQLPIFQWHFVDGGRRVAFGQETVHFGCSVFWELRDVTTGRLFAAVDLPEACGQDPHPAPIKPPAWVTGRNSGIR